MVIKKTVIQVFLVIAIVMGALPVISAADPGNFSSFNSSVQSTEGGGTLTLDRNYTYNNGTDSGFGTNGISVTNDLVVDGNGYTLDAQGSTRIFNVANNVQLTLKNLIIKNTVNHALNFGSKCTLNVINCTFTNCSGTYCFIWMPGSSPVSPVSSTIHLSNSTFCNSSGNYGIFFGMNNPGTWTIDGCTFSNNSMTNSGGNPTSIIYVNSGNTLTLSNSTFTGNIGGDIGDGACVNVQNGATANVSNCTFTNNIAGCRGAALSSIGTMTVTNCTFIGNSANIYNSSTRGGAAIYSSGALTVVGSKFTNNTAKQNGGAILAEGGFSISNSTFIGNSADQGGAIYGRGTVTNSIFSGNNATTGTAVYNSGTLIADRNWWGTNSPDFATLISGSTPSNWIYMNLTTSNIPAYLDNPDKINVSANFNYTTDGTNVTPLTDGTYIPDGLTVYFRTDKGQITSSGTTVNGLATAEYSHTVTVNNENVTATVDANPNSNDFTTGNFYSSTTFSFISKDATAPVVFVDRAGGVYNSAQNVTLSSDDPTAVIYYTLDGTDPKTGGKVYSGPIVVNGNLKLRYIAVDPAGNWSQPYTQDYVIDTVAPVVFVDRAGGVYNSAQNVTLSSDDPTAVIYYTLDGIDPKTGGKVYSGPIVVNGNLKLRYIAVDPAGNWSQPYTQDYVFDTVAPTVKVIDPVNYTVINNANKAVTITFSEAVKYGAGSIFLRNSSGNNVSVKTAINGNVLSITPTSALVNGIYTVVLPAGCVTDVAGNNLAAFTSRFTVDIVAPTVKSIDPVNYAVINNSRKVITVTFSEAVKKGSGLVALKNIKGAIMATKVVVSGNRLTITPTKALSNGVYTVLLSYGSVMDQAGNKLAAYVSRFTVDTVAPKVAKIDPAKNATVKSTRKVITVTFSEAIKKGTGVFMLKNRTGKNVAVKTAISGNKLIIAPTKALSNGTYTVLLYPGSVTDKAGNKMATYTSKFTIKA